MLGGLWQTLSAVAAGFTGFKLQIKRRVSHRRACQSVTGLIIEFLSPEPECSEQHFSKCHKYDARESGEEEEIISGRYFSALCLPS